MRKCVGLLLTLFLTASSLMATKPALSEADVTENTWTTKEPLPISIDSAISAATVNGKIYAMSLSFNYEYDPTTDKWTQKAAMPTPRANFAIAVYQNKIYVIGAYAYSRANEVYDPATNTWETRAQMPTNRTFLSASVFGGKIHLFSREGHDVYDVATDSWTAGRELPYQINWPKSAVIDDKIYVMSYNLTEIYDIKSDTWSLGAASPVAVSNAAVCATTGVMAPKRIYVIGGSPKFFYLTNVTQVYDPINDAWILGEPMPTARAGPAVASVDDYFYVIGGSVGMYYTTDVNQQYITFGYGTVPPTIAVVSPMTKAYNETDVSLVFSVNKPAVWFGYSLDGQENVTVAGNITLTTLANGLHNLTVYANDTSGNMGESETITFTVEIPQEPFPWLPVSAVSVVVAVVAAVTVVVYFKKRKH
jgi:hypothetical protein